MWRAQFCLVQCNATCGLMQSLCTAAFMFVRYIVRRLWRNSMSRLCGFTLSDVDGVMSRGRGNCLMFVDWRKRKARAVRSAMLNANAFKASIPVFSPCHVPSGTYMAQECGRLNIGKSSSCSIPCAITSRGTCALEMPMTLHYAFRVYVERTVSSCHSFTVLP